MSDLVITTDEFAAVREEVLSSDSERCAILLTNQGSPVKGDRLLVREVIFPKPEDYQFSEPLRAELKPDLIARATKYALKAGMGMVFVHSHHEVKRPAFSPIDNEGEHILRAFLAHRHKGLPHAAMVMSRGGVRVRKLGSKVELRVISIGATRDVLFEPSHSDVAVLEEHDRQVRLLGRAGQEKLGSLRIAIVGLGGTGSVIAQELAHLGIRSFALVDPDVIEISNLNRVANARPTDVGRPKVEVAGDYIERVAPSVFVGRIKGDVMDSSIAEALLNADLIFGCTDSHGSRAVLQQIAYQYLIPCIDMGVVVTAAKDVVSHLYGRVQLLSAGLACLTCSGLLDPNQVRRDMMTEFERKADPYFLGGHDPAPAVMSVNGTVSSLAITMMLATVAGLPSRPRHLLYNALNGTLRSVRAEPQAGCYICSADGSLARGASWPLFARSA